MSAPYLPCQHSPSRTTTVPTATTTITTPQARTIDLCNNPRTKEPKLTAARRIIKEWPALDAEQAEFTASIDARFAAQEAAFAEQGDGGAGEDDGDADAGGEDSGDVGSTDHSEL